MSKYKKHKVKISRWKKGRLEIEEREFNSINEAIHYSSLNKGVSNKIYNENDELVLSDDNQTESYA